MSEQTSDSSKVSEQVGESAVSEIFTRVVRDENYKKLLIENPDEALKEYELSDAQLVLIKNLSAEDLENLTEENLQEYFAADAAVYTPDEEDVADYETYSPEDFEEIE